MKNKSVLCITDSLGLPREGVTYRDTWISLMQQAFPDYDFITSSFRGMTINNAITYCNEYWKFYDADYFILQTGICDCAPRFINDRKIIVRLLIRLFKTIGLEKLFWRIIKSFFSRKRDCTYTSKQVFKVQYKTLLKTLIERNKTIVIIKIGKASGTVLAKNKYFNENVIEYNELIDTIVSNIEGQIYTINPLNDVTEDMFVDGYHCNQKGMKVVFNELKLIFSKAIAI